MQKKFVLLLFFTVVAATMSLRSAVAATNATPETSKNILSLFESEQKINEARFRNLEIKIDVNEKKFEIIKEITNIAQKNVDWWIAFLSVFVAVIGIGIPFFLTWKLRAEYRTAVGAAHKAADESKEYLDKISANHAQSIEDTEDIQRRRKLLNDIPTEQKDHKNNSEASETGPTIPLPVIADVLNDPKSSDRDRLRASALSNENDGNWKAATELWKTLSFLDNSNPDPLIRYANALERRSRNEGADEAIASIEKAIAVVRSSIKLSPNNSHALTVLTWLFSALEKIENASERKEHLLKEAIASAEALLIFQPNNVWALTHIGNCTKRLSLIKDSKNEKIRLLQESITKFEDAARIDPKYGIAFTYWGETLRELAVLTENPEEGIQLLKEAIDKLTQAVIYKSDNYSLMLLANTNMDLVNLATSNEDKKIFIMESIVILKKSIELHPNEIYPKIRLANQIAELGKIAENLEEKQRYLNDAVAKLEAIKASHPDSQLALTSLACLKKLDLEKL